LRGQVSLEALVAIAAFLALLTALIAAASSVSESTEVAGVEVGEERLGAVAALSHQLVESEGVVFSEETKEEET